MTSVASTSTPAADSNIESLLGKLNSDDEQMAAREISLLSKVNADNRIKFGKAGAIPLLSQLLKASDPLTQVHAVTALLNLSINNEENKGIIVSSGAVHRMIYILRKGSMEARVNAAATLSSLCNIYKNKVIIGDAGAIPPLASLLREGTQRGKNVAVTTLFNLCLYQGNKERVVRAGVIPILMELLLKGVLKDEALTLLSILSTHPEGMLGIVKAEVVPVMVEVIGSGSPNKKENAASILVELCSRDIKYLVEAQQHGSWRNLRTYYSMVHADRGKEKAGQLLEKLEYHHHHENYPGGDKKPAVTSLLSRLLNKFGNRKGAKFNSQQSAPRISSSDNVKPNDDIDGLVEFVNQSGFH